MFCIVLDPFIQVGQPHHRPAYVMMFVCTKSHEKTNAAYCLLSLVLLRVLAIRVFVVGLWGVAACGAGW